MRELAFVMLGGAFGAGARYLVGGAVHAQLGTALPWGTLAVNAVGCLAIGVLAEWGGGSALSPAARAGLIVGFLGALTTYSAFGYDTFRLFEAGELYRSLAYFGLTTVVCLAAVAAGVTLARSIA